MGAAFGLIFVEVNAHTPLAASMSLVLRLLAGACFVALVVVAYPVGAARSGVEARDTQTGFEVATGSWYGRGFWRVVIAEAVLLIAGLQLLRLTGAPTQANVAWIAVVVGVHFVALASVWQEPSVVVLGAIVLLLGAAGLALSATSAMKWVPILSGVCSGFVLLVGSLGTVAQEAADARLPDRWR